MKYCPKLFSDLKGYWQYFPTGGDRVIYEVIESKDTKQVFILFAGNHDKVKIFLREHR